MSSLRPAFFILTSIALILLIQAGCDGVASPEEEKTRIEVIPADAVKRTPETDAFPPVLHSNDYEQPVPVAGPINTAGAEDSPFIPARSDELYFFFTPDVRVPPEKQILDEVTGIYRSRKTAGVWQEPQLILSSFAGEPTLDKDGNVYFVHHFYEDDVMIEADIYFAFRK